MKLFGETMYEWGGYKMKKIFFSSIYIFIITIYRYIIHTHILHPLWSVGPLWSVMFICWAKWSKQKSCMRVAWLAMFSFIIIFIFWFAICIKCPRETTAEWGRDMGPFELLVKLWLEKGFFFLCVCMLSFRCYDEKCFQK